MITTLSCQGAGLLPEASPFLRLRRGLPASLDILVDGNFLTIRSQIAWHSTDPEGPRRIGLRLYLEACSREVRCAYADWFAVTVRDHRASIAGTPLTPAG